MPLEFAASFCPLLVHIRFSELKCFVKVLSMREIDLKLVLCMNVLAQVVSMSWQSLVHINNPPVTSIHSPVT